MQLREKLSDIFARAQDLVLSTSIEVPIGIALGAVLFGAASFHAENSKRGQIPLAFSEIGRQRDDVEIYRVIDRIPPLTEYYSVTNDTSMMVFEANNLAFTWHLGDWGPFSYTDRFAYELEKKIERTMRIHHQIPEYAQQMPRIGGAAAATLRPLDAVNRDVQPVIQALEDSWDYDRDDHYKTVYYTERECSTDSKGKEHCRNVRKSREEYDYSTHTYTYSKNTGRRAGALVTAFAQTHAQFPFPEQLRLVNRTEAENEWAMRESRRKLSGYKPLTEEDYALLRNKWATGSNYLTYMPVAVKHHSVLIANHGRTAEASRDAHSVSYNTHSRSDAGPRAYQIMEAALAESRGMSNAITPITAGVAFTNTNIHVLNAKAKEFVDVALHGKEGDADKLGREVLTLGRALYDKNFAGGFDVHPFKALNVVGWTFLGMLGGGGLGFGLDKLLDRLTGNRRRRRVVGNYIHLRR